MLHQINPTKHFNKVKQMPSILTYTCETRKRNKDVVERGNVIRTCMWMRNTRNYLIKMFRHRHRTRKHFSISSNTVKNASRFAEKWIRTCKAIHFVFQQSLYRASRTRNWSQEAFIIIKGCKTIYCYCIAFLTRYL